LAHGCCAVGGERTFQAVDQLTAREARGNSGLVEMQQRLTFSNCADVRMIRGALSRWHRADP
jgi:hypothetical protein